MSDLNILWDTGHVDPDAMRIRADDGSDDLVIEIPRQTLEDFAAKAPDDLLERAGGLIGVLSIAIQKAYSPERIMPVFMPNTSIVRDRVLMLRAEDFAER